ncbi:hypothetical protein [Pseudoalteromonas sp. G4]|uniref:hypothetical protein n=1 Tax=Pseudoalteromonas sp. G4 TaxID=2992761 RepID=UPI00237ECAC2|nr:hypothetical protein [Pseudoalteromonas sp. G4]MDE3272458.1 hypothetical protein [Pseudoalteromonas sp. G4]
MGYNDSQQQKRNELKNAALMVRMEMEGDLLEFIPSELGAKHQPLLKKVQEIESEFQALADHGNLRCIYATIARLAIHTHQFELAAAYALAGIELNELAKDKEGVNVNKVVLLDMQMFLGAYKSLVKFLQENPEIATEDRTFLMTDYDGKEGSENDGLATDLLSTKLRPQSYAIAIEAINNPCGLSAEDIAKHLGVTVETALKYKR